MAFVRVSLPFFLKVFLKVSTLCLLLSGCTKPLTGYLGLPTTPINFSDGSLSTSLTESPIFYWSAATDAHSGLNSYVISIGTTVGGTNVLNWTNVGNVTTYQFSGLSLAPGTLYYASIKSLDNAGNSSAIVQGNGWRTSILQKIADNVQPQVRMASAGSNYGADVVVSANGLTMAVGAYVDNLDASGSNYLSAAGAVFMYIYSGGTWQFQQKIVGLGINGRLANDYFGGSIALGGETGDTLAIGVSSQDYDTAGANYLASAGAVFIFTRVAGAWSLQQKIVGEGTNGRLGADYFGYKVALSRVGGDTLAAVAYGQNYDGAGANYKDEAGAVFIFTRVAGAWSLQQKVAGEGPNSRPATFDPGVFGDSMALGGTNGDTLAVAACEHDYDVAGINLLSNAGAVFVFTRIAGVWSQQEKLVGTGINGRLLDDYFGHSVALGGTSGDILAVGAGGAGSFGQDYDALGTNYAAQAGAAFVYTRTSSTWSLQQKVIATGTNGRLANDLFGSSVALGGTDANILAVGAPKQNYDGTGANYVASAGAVFVYH